MEKSILMSAVLLMCGVRAANWASCAVVVPKSCSLVIPFELTKNVEVICESNVPGKGCVDDIIDSKERLDRLKEDYSFVPEALTAAEDFLRKTGKIATSGNKRPPRTRGKSNPSTDTNASNSTAPSSLQLATIEEKDTCSEDFLEKIGSLVKKDPLLSTVLAQEEATTPQYKNTSLGLLQLSLPERRTPKEATFETSTLNAVWNRVKQAANFAFLSLPKIPELVQTYFSKPQEPVLAEDENIEDAEYAKEVPKLTAPESNTTLDAEEKPQELVLEEVIAPDVAPESTERVEEPLPESTPELNETTEGMRSAASEGDADESNESENSNESNESEDAEPGSGITKAGILSTTAKAGKAEMVLEDPLSEGREFLKKIGLIEEDEAVETDETSQEAEALDTTLPEGELNKPPKKPVYRRKAKARIQEKLEEENLEQPSVAEVEIRAPEVVLVQQPKSPLVQPEPARTPTIAAKTEEGTFMSAINYIFSLPLLVSKTALSFVSWTAGVFFDLLNLISKSIGLSAKITEINNRSESYALGRVITASHLRRATASILSLFMKNR